MDMMVTKDRGIYNHEILDFILHSRQHLLSRINCLR